MITLLFVLTAKVQALKKTATKGDKKKKKEVADEIAKLESDMEARHLVEEKQLKVPGNK
jgi:OTU domain-containing protein 6